MQLFVGSIFVWYNFKPTITKTFIPECLIRAGAEIRLHYDNVDYYVMIWKYLHPYWTPSWTTISFCSTGCPENSGQVIIITCKIIILSYYSWLPIGTLAVTFNVIWRLYFFEIGPIFLMKKITVCIFFTIFKFDLWRLCHDQHTVKCKGVCFCSHYPALLNFFSSQP